MSFGLSLEEKEGKEATWLRQGLKLGAQQGVSQCPSAAVVCFDYSLSNWEKALGIKSLYRQPRIAL